MGSIQLHGHGHDLSWIHGHSCCRRPYHAYLSFTALLPCVQAVLRESRELHGDLESMAEKVELLSEVLQVESMSQQVCELSRHTEELQQSIKIRLQSLEDANKVQRKKRFICFTCLFFLLLCILFD